MASSASAEKHKRLKDRIDRLERFSDIRNHFYDSGFEAWPGENPDLQIYELVETIVGARWVSLDLLSIVFFISNSQTAQPSIRNVIFGFFNLAPGNKVAMDISFGTSTSYSLVLARAFYDVRYNNPLYSATLSSVLCSL